MTEAARSAEAILQIIRQYIIKTHGELPEPVDLDTPLLGSGLVDSFGLVEIGRQVSRTFGIPLLSGNLLPEDFETPNTLWTRIEELSA